MLQTKALDIVFCATKKENNSEVTYKTNVTLSFHFCGSRQIMTQSKEMNRLKSNVANFVEGKNKILLYTIIDNPIVHVSVLLKH
jgi:hypothetical protein